MSGELRDLTIRHSNVPTAPRRQAFLDALRSTGQFRVAARAVATPEQLERGGDPASSWHSLRRRDATFALEVDGAMADHLSSIEDYARRFATGTLTRPQFFEGRKVADVPIIDSSSGNVLLRYLEKLSKQWRQHRELSIVRDDAAGEASLQIRMSELGQLDEEDRHALARICVNLKRIRATADVTDVTDAISAEEVGDDDADDPYNLTELAEINQ